VLSQSSESIEVHTVHKRDNLDSALWV